MVKAVTATKPKGKVPQRSGTSSQPQPKEEREKPALEAPSYQSMMQKVYGARVDAVDKKFGMTAYLTKQPRLPTGLLSLDLMLGQGLVPGHSVLFGMEQSAKSTASMTILRSSLGRRIPVRKYFDPEGAVDIRYTGNILNVDSFTDVFGDMNRAGKWIKDPLCLYHDETGTENVMRDMHHTLMFMPDKRYHKESDQWYLVFDRTDAQRAMCKEMIAAKMCEEPNKALYSKTGRYWCSIGDDDAPQGIFFLDSLPALTPEKVDDDEKGQGLAIDARVLGPLLKMVRGRLRPKGVILVSVNQLRDQPMPKPGQAPWREPMGNVVKFTSDSRTMFTSRVPLEGFPKWKDHGGLCAEPSVEYENSTDIYAFKGFTNIKNKWGTAMRKSSGRVWIKDGSGEPRGFDPVYDTWNFLNTLGAIEGFRPLTVTSAKYKFFINLKPVIDIDWTWAMFKAMIIGQHDNDRRVLKIAADLGAPVRFDLRGYCRKLIAAGKSEDMLAAYLRDTEKGTGGGVDIEADDVEADDE